MSVERKIAKRTERRALRVRRRLDTSRPRVSVFRSLNHMYAQLIDDTAQKTIASCSTLTVKLATGDKKARAFEVGKELARRAREAGVESAVFDRGSFLYHGRVKALAEGLREGGLKI